MKCSNNNTSQRFYPKKCPLSPIYQWGLRYTTDSVYGINACPAWCHTEGENVTVAIIDFGIDKTEPDLSGNIHPYSYDLHTETSPSQCYGSTGTFFAGIIAAVKDNNVGIVGVAPKAKVMAISGNVHGNYEPDPDPSFTAQIAGGFSVAWQNGADIIHCSWGDEGGYFNSLHSDILEEAILNAMNNGRNGKGTVVVFSAGYSYNPNQMDYPAYFHDDLITVGAITKQGEWHSDSGYGQKLDVVAPGQTIRSIPTHLWNSGSRAAAPFVSGVAALILSANPNLTVRQVGDIIERTAQKIKTDSYPYLNTNGKNNGSWNEKMGYGLVDAIAAVENARACNPEFAPPMYNEDIITDALWEKNSLQSHSYTVNNGATLTIRAAIRFVAGASITVKAGGKLIVDGGTLTNACSGEMWQGIIVEGNSSLSQDIYSYQGHVTLQNGAIIENAVTAISTCASPKSGGVISATNTTFRNNATAVKIYPYISYSNYYNSELVYIGNFTLCNFIFDNTNLLTANGLHFSEHINLSGVNGIRFKGCTFQKIGTGNTNAGPKAINAHNAGFSINEYCGMTMHIGQCVCPITPVRSSFSGFYRGILVNTSGTQRYVSVSNTDFSNILYSSIEINGMHNVGIVNSNFAFNDGVFSSGSPVGITLNNATGYNIEGNKFQGTTYTHGMMNPPRVGISVNNSGTAENSIYRNQFINMSIGINVSGVNGFPNTSGTIQGLQFTCNEFSGGSRDIYATGYMRFHQGSSSKGADNDFITSQLASIVTLSYPINYYRSNQIYHTPINSGQKVTILSGAANNCASTLCDIVISYTNTSPFEQYDQLSKKMAEEKSLYKSIISDNKQPTLSASQKAELSNLESSISKLSLQMNEISQRAIGEILQDTIEINLPQLSEWYSRMPTASADYSLVETYYHQGNYSLADNALISMIKEYDYDDIQLVDYDNYGRFHALKNTLQISERYWDALTEAEIDELKSIAEASDERSSTMAKGVLCFFYNICFEDEIIAKNDAILPLPKSAPMESTTPATSDIQVFPNPVEDNLTVSIPALPKGTIIFQLVDVNGRIMLSQALTSDYSTINLSSLPNGIYQYQILHNGVSLKSDKVVKQ